MDFRSNSRLPKFRRIPLQHSRCRNGAIHDGKIIDAFLQLRCPKHKTKNKNYIYAGHKSFKSMFLESKS